MGRRRSRDAEMKTAKARNARKHGIHLAMLTTFSARRRHVRRFSGRTVRSRSAAVAVT